MSLQSSIVLLLVLLGCIALPARGQSGKLMTGTVVAEPTRG